MQQSDQPGTLLVDTGSATCQCLHCVGSRIGGGPSGTRSKATSQGRMLLGLLDTTQGMVSSTEQRLDAWPELGSTEWAQGTAWAGLNHWAALQDLSCPS